MAEEIAARVEIELVHDRSVDDDQRSGRVGRGLDAVELAVVIGADGRFWYYDVRYWRPVSEHWLSGRVAANARWLEHANPLPAFVEGYCVKNPVARCRLREFFAVYSEWALDMGFALTQNQQTVSLNLEHLGFGVEIGSHGKAVVGLALNESNCSCSKSRKSGQKWHLK